MWPFGYLRIPTTSIPPTVANFVGRWVTSLSDSSANPTCCFAPLSLFATRRAALKMRIVVMAPLTSLDKASSSSPPPGSTTSTGWLLDVQLLFPRLFGVCSVNTFKLNTLIGVWNRNNGPSNQSSFHFRIFRVKKKNKQTKQQVERSGLKNKGRLVFLAIWKLNGLPDGSVTRTGRTPTRWFNIGLSIFI